MKSFADTLDEAGRTLVAGLRQSILSADRSVIEKPGRIMRARDAICYLQDGVMKYGLAGTKVGVSFHSMVMYAHPDITEFVRARLTGIKMQKGCINITSPERFDFDAFDQMLLQSAEKDFQPVITHYKTRKKRAGT